MRFTAASARKYFARSLVGTWESYLGSGNDMHLGMRMVFHADGTGTMEEWGNDYSPDYSFDPAFTWKCVEDFNVEFIHRGKTSFVSYDFFVRKNEYGVAELRLVETGREPDSYGDVGFWLSPFSRVHRGSPERAPTWANKIVFPIGRFFQRIRRKPK